MILRLVSKGIVDAENDLYLKSSFSHLQVLLRNLIWKNLHYDTHDLFKQEVRSMNTSSLQGIVRPPIRWSKPNSSSAWANNSWNKGWLKYDTGITNLLFWLSPTYTAQCPFGIPPNVQYFLRIRLARINGVTLVPIVSRDIWQLLIMRAKKKKFENHTHNKSFLECLDTCVLLEFSLY